MKNDAQIKQMVDRFLCWKLPKDFAPDSGISFTPTKPYEGDEYGNSWWPIGTNLLSAEQAEAMIRHILEVPNVELTGSPASGESVLNAGLARQKGKK